MIPFALIVGGVVAAMAGVLVYRNATTRGLTHPVVWSLATGLVAGSGVAWVLGTDRIVRRIYLSGSAVVVMRPVERLLIQLVIALLLSALVVCGYRLSTHGGPFTDQTG